MAAELGFDAYGMTADAPDPVSNAINGMLDHMHEMHDRVDQLSRAMCAMGRQVEDLRPLDIDFPCDDFGSDKASPCAESVAVVQGDVEAAIAEQIDAAEPEVTAKSANG